MCNTSCCLHVFYVVGWIDVHGWGEFLLTEVNPNNIRSYIVVHVQYSSKYSSTAAAMLKSFTDWFFVACVCVCARAMVIGCAPETRTARGGKLARIALRSKLPRAWEGKIKPHAASRTFFFCLFLRAAKRTAACSSIDKNHTYHTALPTVTRAYHSSSSSSSTFQGVTTEDFRRKRRAAKKKLLPRYIYTCTSCMCHHCATEFNIRHIYTCSWPNPTMHRNFFSTYSTTTSSYDNTRKIFFKFFCPMMARWTHVTYRETPPTGNWQCYSRQD